jgi:formylglycine-generating enzyme required for sulfatase activity
MGIENQFCHVLSGTYTLGASRDEMALLREQGLTFYLAVGLRRTYVRGFWIRKYPVTVGEWLAFSRAYPRYRVECVGYTVDEDADDYFELTDQADPRLPMLAIPHGWAARFAKWKGGRLPTATEWEAAARGKDGRPYPWGREARTDVGRQERCPRVGWRPELASPYGVEDLVGVAAEWTSDLLDDKAIVKGSPYNVRTALHLADEAAYRPATRMFNVGFRYVID